ncbi:hypothetical protein K493DRAFT_313656 [Basidiobolus meristosporus CBS 931.73]|uniref:Uncharacterized protein n=1 Tax=Basidiobolus meristosporus CBS 931.73 TaxID=1314790 RepID=A0A1Y1YK99_9FUNG|nr:hypothetical protein K493DRAFT_313656 [Basidiobolus meristosporus CBS 931.73]|eukprot:ORX98408.1 hypothetical protein K493DRAFT_313656 [Basidiobolus meristosporus CBS 931.73]
MTYVDTYNYFSNAIEFQIDPEEANQYDYYMVPERYSDSKPVHDSSFPSPRSPRFQSSKEIEYHRALALRYKVILTYTR